MTASVTVTAAVPSPTETLPNKRNVQFYDLPEFCKTDQEVKIESLGHSTAFGFFTQRGTTKVART